MMINDSDDDVMIVPDSDVVMTNEAPAECALKLRTNGRACQ